MTARTVSARDLETMAHAAHERVELPGPEGGWAVAVINGRLYRARVAAVTVEERIEAAIEALPALTEGHDRAGTARWPERDRDTYSLAIEEAQSALRSALTEETP